ncbi:hypothetical protein Nepgr_002457 [Nepenthes gracilis]|uniref:Uncharacterized protein n=1 Tax=Nepenthes gracilis TaxID=150966 RepID=A0AAD3RY89_NEPGR|nr:hypothetical protein Nepgr_002457 [Nepenthes gracilis]
MSSSLSFSFLQSTFASSQQLLLHRKLEISRPQTLPVIDSKACTCRQDRAAHHSCIRKKLSEELVPESNGRWDAKAIALHYEISFFVAR